MRQFTDKQFDVVFSNSVIEHVGTYEDQTCMAREVQRVGKRYFIQTPNFYFPIEPHFLFPFFQFLPVAWKILLVERFNVRYRYKEIKEALSEARIIRMLTKKELRQLFPGATLYEERFLGFVKSFIAYEGFEC